MSATSSAETGKSRRAWSPWGTDGDAAAEGHAALARGELAEQDAEERRLAAAVRAEHADRPAARRLEVDVAQDVAAPVP